VTWVYEPRGDGDEKRWVVGYWRPAWPMRGESSGFAAIEEYESQAEAAQRVHYLNGGSGSTTQHQWPMPRNPYTGDERLR